MELKELDSNFYFPGITTPNLRWYDRYTKEFSFDGCQDLKNFHRIDMERDLPSLPEGVREGYRCTGITLRFRTNAKVVAIKSVLWRKDSLPMMPLTASHGFDIYVAPVPTEKGAVSYVPRVGFTFRPKPEEPEIVSGEYPLKEEFHPGEWHDIEIGFPLYNGVLEFAVGLNGEAEILPPSPLAESKPVVFYGSSITQGACASKPGTCYTTLLARNMRLPQINLGFSGRAKGEPEVAAYIAKLPMCAFVMDYDYNSESPKTLSETHEPFFKIIRAAQPNLPVILISRANYEIETAEVAERFRIIKKTYDDAKAAGDRHVYLIDGHTIYGDEQRDSCTVDFAHPTDFGFVRMYQAVRPVLEKALAERDM